MTIIAPSLLSCDFLNIESELKAFEFANNIWFHLDIMDGHFVPNLTFGHPVVEKLKSKTKHPLDAHFMVTNPAFYCDTFKDFGLHNFTFHYESLKDPIAFIKSLKRYYPSVGISIKPGTQVDVLKDEILLNIDLVLVMSVEPGFGGQKFMPNSLDKIKWLVKKQNQLNKKFIIQIDGGINKETGKQAVEAGANNLVAGSFIFKPGATQYIQQIESLRS